MKGSVPIPPPVYIRDFLILRSLNKIQFYLIDQVSGGAAIVWRPRQAAGEYFKIVMYC